MFYDSIIYESKLLKLRAGQRRVSAQYAAQIESAKRARVSFDELQRIRQDESRDYKVADEEIRHLQTRHLTRTARDLFLPHELQVTDWIEGETGVKFITLDAANRLETAIRAKIAERRQVWLPLLSGLTGILGALTGLLAIILRK